MESFVERWFQGGDGPAWEVWHVAERALFEVRADGVVLFASARFVEILRFCMHDEAQPGGPEAQPEVSPAEAIELSPWEPDP